MINNFAQIRDLLRFPDTNSFYFLEIIKRRKENPEMERHMNLLRDYYIYSFDEFDKLMPKIISLCDENNARAYFRLNLRNVKKIAFLYNKRLAELLITEDYKSIPKIYPSVVGEFQDDSNKKWLIDIDFVDGLDVEYIVRYIDKLEPHLVSDTPDGSTSKVVARIPTKNGLHLITKPFRMDFFKKEFPAVDVHKDNPTILYQP